MDSGYAYIYARSRSRNRPCAQCADRWSVVRNCCPTPLASLCMTTVARACRPFCMLFSTPLCPVQRRRRASTGTGDGGRAARAGPSSTRTQAVVRGHGSSRGRVSCSRRRHPHQLLAGTTGAPCRSPARTLQRPRSPCYRAHHTRHPDCLLARAPPGAPPPRVHRAALISHLPLLCAQTSFVLPATGDTCEPPGVGLHGFGGGVGGRRCSHDVVWLVGSGHMCRPVSMDVYTAYFCSCRDSCVVYRMSCSAAMAYSQYLSSSQKKKTPFEPNARSLLL